MRPLHLVIVAALSLVAACGSGGSSYSTDAAGAKALATALNGNPALLATLKPTLAECKAIVADEASAQKLLDHANEVYAQAAAEGIKGKPDQTEVMVAFATSADLKAGKGGDLPGGYVQVASKLKDGLSIWVIRYVKPGETLGMAFDGLVAVGGRWVFVPKFWKALK